ncbi:hypothetical protein V1227_34480 [Lentzea sp. DG1S-22]|nr:hypothetical protein [Lentzea sp. DG1S-22]WVH80074.1 hypothetical protein V1227_34480 [Lentzea sp. DG1S-22]
MQQVPEAPPNLPFVTFTEVTVRNTDLIGGTRKVPARGSRS